MIPIVNDKHQYILMYSAKAGSTSSRLLYTLLHADEFSSDEQAQLDHYHNLNEVHAFDSGRDYSSYTKFLITRNPYSRIVSAYLDQYVYAKNSGVQTMLRESPPEEGSPANFLEFLQYLQTVPDAQRDTHFQTQAYFFDPASLIQKTNRIERLLKGKPKLLGLDYISDIRSFDKSMRSVYAKIFSADKPMLKKARQHLDSIQKSNSSLYGEADFGDAALLSEQQLNELVFAPKPQHFFANQQVKRLVEEIYSEDFRHFNYSLGKLPYKKTSKEISLIPADFDWQTYLKTGVDLPRDEIYNERSVIRHYLEFGRFETDPPRFYKLEAPQGFEWQRYLSLHSDLRAAGIDNERDAITHYLTYGVREQREI